MMGWPCACSAMSQTVAAEVLTFAEVATFLDQARCPKYGVRTPRILLENRTSLQRSPFCNCISNPRVRVVTTTKGGTRFLQHKIKACSNGDEESSTSLSDRQSKDQDTDSVAQLMPGDELDVVPESMRSETLFTTVVKPLIRIVNGNYFSKESQGSDVTPSEKERQVWMSMLWNPLGRLDDAVFRKKIGNAWQQAEADFYAVRPHKPTPLFFSWLRCLCKLFIDDQFPWQPCLAANYRPLPPVYRTARKICFHHDEYRRYTRNRLSVVRCPFDLSLFRFPTA